MESFVYWREEQKTKGSVVMTNFLAESTQMNTGIELYLLPQRTSKTVILAELSFPSCSKSWW